MCVFIRVLLLVDVPNHIPSVILHCSFVVCGRRWYGEEMMGMGRRRWYGEEMMGMGRRRWYGEEMMGMGRR